MEPSFKIYNNYGSFLRRQFDGKRVYKVIVDGGFTCPNRDGSKGYGGCTYCNVDSFTPEISRKTPSITEQIQQNIQRAKNSYRAEAFIAYFQPNTNTYASVARLKAMFDEAIAAGGSELVGLAVGTRADCLDKEKIALLESYTDRLVVDLEVGMESMYEDTLLRINRGASHQDFVQCLSLLAHSPLQLCVHMIFGFPWETRQMMLDYAHEINRFPQIKFVKFHHLHVVEGSIMGVHYKREPFPLFSLDDYADFLCELLPLVRPDIVVQRLFGLSDLEYLIAPIWGKKKVVVQSYIEARLQQRGIVQGSKYQ